MDSCLVPFSSESYVVKPEVGCGGVGVGKETAEWGMSVCESWSGVKCLRQPLHPGPWELRFVLSNQMWRGFGFIAGWVDENTDSPMFEVDIEEWKHVLTCIQSRFPLSPNLALDIRARDATSWFLCEINGALGIDYSWVLGFPDPLWLAARIASGGWIRGVMRVPKALAKTVFRWKLAKEWQFEILTND